MSELPDFPCDNYDPRTVMARVAHLPVQAQRDIEQISRIIRAAFGYGGPDMPAAGRIIGIALTGSLANRQRMVDEIAGYDFHIAVNPPECADEAHWHFARKLIASEIGERHPVTLAVEAGEQPCGIVLYDAAVDMPLNARELSFKS